MVDFHSKDLSMLTWGGLLLTGAHGNAPLVVGVDNEDHKKIPSQNKDPIPTTRMFWEYKLEYKPFSAAKLAATMRKFGFTVFSTFYLQALIVQHLAWLWFAGECFEVLSKKPDEDQEETSLNATIIANSHPKIKKIDIFECSGYFGTSNQVLPLLSVNHLTLYTPQYSTVLIEDLTFSIGRGEHLLVSLTKIVHCSPKLASVY